MTHLLNYFYFAFLVYHDLVVDINPAANQEQIATKFENSVAGYKEEILDIQATLMPPIFLNFFKFNNCSLECSGIVS